MLKYELKNIFKLKKRADKNIIRPIRHLRRDWRAVVIIFFAVNIAVLAFSRYIFFGVARGEVFTSVKKESLNINSIDRKILEEALDYIDKKDEEFKYLRSVRLEKVDPSR